MTNCPLCGAPCDPRLLAKSRELRPSIVRLIRQQTTTWQPDQGICPDCALVYAEQFAAQRSPVALNALSDPPTTFPFYHPDEETVLSQPERLPAYDSFSGRGMTIAFLDSGYYPHPDLTAEAFWPDPQPAWPQLDAASLRTLLEPAQLRLVAYVDLTDGNEEVGLALPSLWDAAGSSWHGQMTTTLAAGNGLLSSGHFRGYAHQANLLPIKIGRSNGRIPEADILAGLRWLLCDDNWLRYNVRVVNVAVGGDVAEPWFNNLVCLAAEELSDRGVLICAAAGNSGQNRLLAPAQAPSVLTVGGYEDANRRWDPSNRSNVAMLTRYHHNYGRVLHHGRWRAKPELLALGRYLPAPILPPSPVFAETYTLGELRRLLLENASTAAVSQGDVGDTWRTQAWRAVRMGMNAHKWVQPYYQHVDGTSVAVTQVSAVAAQMFQAAPQLTGQEAKELLLATALPLHQDDAAMTGHGILQPTRAVAAALRTHHRVAQHFPPSGTLLRTGELQRWVNQGKLSAADFAAALTDADVQPVYFGIYWPGAQRVSVVGAWNSWQPADQLLQPQSDGWWHSIIWLPPGRHLYRFWLEDATTSAPSWQPDPENPLRCESGYGRDHSVIFVD